MRCLCKMCVFLWGVARSVVCLLSSLLIWFCLCPFFCTAALSTQTAAISSTARCFSLFISSDVGWPTSWQPGRPITHPAHLQRPSHPLIYSLCCCFRPGVNLIWNGLQGWLSLSCRNKAIGLKVQRPAGLLFMVLLNRQWSLCCSPAFRHKVRIHFLACEYTDKYDGLTLHCFSYMEGHHLWAFHWPSLEFSLSYLTKGFCPVF